MRGLWHDGLAARPQHPLQPQVGGDMLLLLLHLLLLHPLTLLHFASFCTALLLYCWAANEVAMGSFCCLFCCGCHRSWRLVAWPLAVTAAGVWLSDRWLSLQLTFGCLTAGCHSSWRLVANPLQLSPQLTFGCLTAVLSPQLAFGCLTAGCHRSWRLDA